MDVRQTLLLLAAEALEDIKSAREEAMKIYKELKVTYFYQSLHKRVLDADQDLCEKLSVAIPISAMYAAQYAGQRRRYTRVASLAEACLSSSRALEEAMIVLDRESGAKPVDLGHRLFTRAVKMLELAQKGLKHLVASNTTSNDSNRVHPLQIASDPHHKSLDGNQHEASALVPAGEYLRTRFRYEEKSKASKLKDDLTQRELGSIVVEKLRLPFQRFLVLDKPIYPGFGDREEDAEMGKFYCFDQLNAIWQSLLAADCIDSRDAITYEKLYFAITSITAKQTKTRSDDPIHEDRNPVLLAKGLRTLDIALGIVFRDDPSVVVWPLGKSPQDEQRDVIIYCRGNGRTYHSYEGVRFLKEGETPTRPPRAQYAFSDIRNTTWSERREFYYAPLGPLDTGFLASILAIVNQSSPAWRPFPFLRLPAELRNNVYEEYLLFDDSRFNWTRPERRPIRIGRALNIPELCQTSHQLLSEAFPIYLQKNTFAFRVSYSRFCSLGTQPVLRPFLKLTRIDLNPCPKVTISLRLTEEGSGFTIDYTDVRCRHFRQTMTDFLARPEQFEALVKIIAEDTTTGGFSFAEIAVINEFLFSDNKEQKKLNGKV